MWESQQALWLWSRERLVGLQAADLPMSREILEILSTSEDPRDPMSGREPRDLHWRAESLEARSIGEHNVHGVPSVHKTYGKQTCDDRRDPQIYIRIMQNRS